MKTNSLVRHILGLVIASISLHASSTAAAPMSLADAPLLWSSSVAPLNLLVMGRDHKLYFEAYNDHSDLNNDGVLDITYEPDQINYYGYFDSKKCYAYSQVSKLFTATSMGSGSNGKQCSGAWSGDWLNYITTSRLDALRKVLYGGKRSTDAAGNTILERSYVPQEAHTWAKGYINTSGSPVTENGYDLTKYTPLALPSSGTSHLFANVTLATDTNNEPKLRYVLNAQYGDGTALNPYVPMKPWNWVSIEHPNANSDAVIGVNSSGGEIRAVFGASTPSGTKNGTVLINDMVVRVKACDTSFGISNLEENCRAYTDSSTNAVTYKPAGLLQEFGEDGRMNFGLLTGTYAHNLNGGVLRKLISAFTNEVNLNNGTYLTSTSPRTYKTAGIIQTLDNLTVTGFSSSYQYGCGRIDSRALADGECQMWGNPIAEMMYEGLRYFEGKTGATSGFSITAGQGEESGLNLPIATWNSSTDPYKTFGRCAKPIETVISDINNSYDSDSLPGSYFNSFSGDVSGLNVQTAGQDIWNNEFGVTKNVFIGQSGVAVTGPLANAPTSKPVTSFGNIRGLAPEEPSKQGSYYPASVAYFAHTNDISSATGTQTMNTYVVALASPLPRIEITINGKKVTLIPYARTVNGTGGCAGGVTPSGNFQPTDQIVDFYVDSLTSTSGRFRVSFEDQEQGSDFDMDAIATYTYLVSGSTVSVTVSSDYASGCYVQHMGYIISGTTNDGIYLEVTDRDSNETAEVDYKLDTPPGVWFDNSGASTAWKDNKALPIGTTGVPMRPLQPITTTRTFTVGSTPGAELLQSPLWYAAKYGGFVDKDLSTMPNTPSEWDKNGDGVPDNYFLVTNALTLKDQMSAAFNEILQNTGAAAAAAVNSGSVGTNTRIYQAVFKSQTWEGFLYSFKVTSTGAIDTSSGAEWEASSKLPTNPASRKIFTIGSEASFTPKSFDWTTISTDSIRSTQLDANSSNAQCILQYLRGDRTYEVGNSGGSACGNFSSQFRLRADSRLGDIIDSAPNFVGPPSYDYSDTLESKPYSAFAVANKSRTNALYVGANDGMLHAFNADIGSSSGGSELFAFIPSPVFKNLYKLADATNYPGNHQYYVDGSPTTGDVFYGNAWHTVLVGGLNKGGQGIYALDITDPSSFGTSKVLWEFTDKQDSDLGYTFSQPVIARLNNGKWAAIFGNGYNNVNSDATDTVQSTTGHAVLYIVDIQNGTLIRKIDTGAGSTGLPNGLASVAVIDNNGDVNADYVYAGDLLGNMWKFDLTDTTSASNWKVAYTVAGKPTPLFIAKDSSNNLQPITSRPEVIRGPNGQGMTVLFGTGKWLEYTDKTVVPSKPQSFYGLYDTNTGSNTDLILSRASLGAQTILSETAIGTQTKRTTSKNPAGVNGWYMDLIPPSGTYAGERVVASPVVRNGLVFFITLFPQSSDPCGTGGLSWLMALGAQTGQESTLPVIDVNGDGKLDALDLDSGGAMLGGASAAGTNILSIGNGTAEALNPDDSCQLGQQCTIPNTVKDLRLGRQSWHQLR